MNFKKMVLLMKVDKYLMDRGLGNWPDRGGMHAHCESELSILKIVRFQLHNH